MEKRIGRFTSSQIYKLMAVPKRGSSPFLQSGLTYIRQKYLEREIANTLDTYSYSNAMAWGKFMEAYLFRNHFSLDYTTTSQETIVSEKYPDHLAGTPDFVKKGELVSEVKCFYQEKWAELGIALKTQDIDTIKERFPEIYWQVVCNAHLLGLKRCEIVSFMPSVDEMENVKEFAEDPMFLHENNLGEMWEYRFIYERDIAKLPHVRSGSKIPSLSTFEFDVPQEDFDLLEERIEMAIELLENQN